MAGGWRFCASVTSPLSPNHCYNELHGQKHQATAIEHYSYPQFHQQAQDTYGVLAHTHTKPGRACVCPMHPFPLLGACEGAAGGMQSPQLPLKHSRSSPTATGHGLRCSCHSRGIPKYAGGTQGKQQGGTFPSGRHWYARCGVAAYTFGAVVSLSWKTWSNKEHKRREQHFNVEAGDCSQNQHTKDGTKQIKRFNVSAKSALSLCLSPDYPEIPVHKGKEKTPRSYGMRKPLTYLRTEWYIKVQDAAEFQNWRTKLFYWCFFPVHEGFLTI